MAPLVPLGNVWFESPMPYATMEGATDKQAKHLMPDPDIWQHSVL